MAVKKKVGDFNAKPVMPKATAMWLILNTKLTFTQIATFCKLHLLEVQAMADDELGRKITPISPISMGQLAAEEIKRCENDVNSTLKMSEIMKGVLFTKNKAKKYTPVALRREKANAILWVINRFSTANSKEIAKILGTTEKLVDSIRTKTHWNYEELEPKDPVLLGICNQSDLDSIK
ncbi:cell cycle transcriptional regulator TrcR [Candidatus Fokinia crypta]|uniref:DUF1013 domain-containing protein n=1 Tax=Candidatus Fokinia crypta TaxID=1920990 RepID=A0ABZ0UPK9_9RICK|nr:cell cycle transcriptional regulator TrcR [Candidatus Fokinia cryptica]WPX98046.1 DUF1013 domain-containing protein [Candidatus Fokinia cryptica]